MNSVLEKGIEAIRTLPEDRQAVAGELLLTIATDYELAPEQVAELKLSAAEAARGEFASDAAVEAFWKKCGV